MRIHHLLPILATLAISACGPRSELIRLTPPLPDSAHPADGTVVAVGPFEDSRAADWHGAKVGEWIPGGGEKYKVSYVISGPAADLVRDLVTALLEKDGFAVLRTSDPQAAKGAVLTGRIETLETRLGKGAWVGSLECRIRLALTVARRGKTVAQKDLEVKHMRHSATTQPEAYQRVTEEALGKLLAEVEAYVDSAAFRKAVRQ
ncbi:MAG TPA: hypothetical protein VM369_01655 [Candidatus Binatia bacterium]|nr:hypothetical protein [Candidatus Binatia bacterium]